MIAEDRHVDVLEMDAASHTGVGDIRDLIDTVHYAPTSARYKIYIIDEVHMLSGSAFNALLKTLEEPPQKTVFCLLTDSEEKLLSTIVSRCQVVPFLSQPKPFTESILQHIHLPDSLLTPTATIAQFWPTLEGLQATLKATGLSTLQALSLPDC